MQQQTQRPVQFEVTEQTRQAVADWVRRTGLKSDDYLFPSRVQESPHLSTRQYARIVDGWVREIGLDPAAYGTRFADFLRKATRTAKRNNGIKSARDKFFYSDEDGLLVAMRQGDYKYVFSE